MHDESLEQVQSKIAYLERAMVELSDVVFRQHQEIQALQAQLKIVKERLEGPASGRRVRAPRNGRLTTEIRMPMASCEDVKCSGSFRLGG
jgi:SlyX protein